MGWLLFACAMSCSAVMWWAAGVRTRRMKRVRDTASTRAVEDLQEGRYRIFGKVVPIETTPSLIDGMSCVLLERAEYRSLSGAMRRIRDHTFFSHAFFVEDGSGRVLVDPANACVEAVTIWDDDGLTAERRVRAGEEVEVIASFHEVELDPMLDGGGGPYRGAVRVWATIAGPWGPPQISYRTEPNMVAHGDDISAFLRGAGAMLVGITLLALALF